MGVGVEGKVEMLKTIRQLACLHKRALKRPDLFFSINQLFYYFKVCSPPLESQTGVFPSS